MWSRGHAATVAAFVFAVAAGAVSAGGGRLPPGFVQEGAKLTAPGEDSTSFGSSVAVSADGETALIGAPQSAVFGKAYGTAWVFVRSGSRWVLQAKLTATSTLADSRIGSAVALSADGNTVLVGAPGSNPYYPPGISHGYPGPPVPSAAWVFVRSGKSWDLAAKLTPRDATAAASSFGSAVALSGDGGTAVIGNEDDAAARGAAFVFTGAGTNWAQQGPKLTAGGSRRAGFGSSVAVSSDGNTALIGGRGVWSSRSGAAWVFTRAGSVWTRKGSRLTPSDEEGKALVGSAVALSGNGKIALIGGPGDGGAPGRLATGAAWIFTRAGTTWTQSGSKLFPALDTARPLGFGSSVAISGDAGIALIGSSRAGAFGPGYLGAPGAVWVFARSGARWKQHGSTLVFRGGVRNAHGVEFGESLALNGDGRFVLIGGPGDSSSDGAVWTFASAR